MSNQVKPLDGSPNDLSQLTLPQIARAVAAGDVRIEDAEVELRRRPVEPRRERRMASRPLVPPPPRPPADLAKLVEATRRELHQTTKRLAQLSKRLDLLANLAEPPPVTSRSTRRRRPDRDDASLTLIEDDNDANEAA